MEAPTSKAAAERLLHASRSPPASKQVGGVYTAQSRADELLNVVLLHLRHIALSFALPSLVVHTFQGAVSCTAIASEASAQP